MAAKRIAFGRPLSAPFAISACGGVAGQILEHAQDVVGIGVDLEPRRDIDMIVDRVRVVRRGAGERVAHDRVRSKRRRSGAGRCRPRR